MDIKKKILYTSFFCILFIFSCKKYKIDEKDEKDETNETEQIK